MYHRENPLFWHFVFGVFFIPLLLILDPKEFSLGFYFEMILIYKMTICLLAISSFIFNLVKISSAWISLLLTYILILPSPFVLDMPFDASSPKDPRVLCIFMAIFGIYHLLAKRIKYLRYLKYSKSNESF